MSPALSTSSSFTRLNEVEHKIQLSTLTHSLMKQQQQRRSVSFAVAAHSAFGKERQDTLDEKKTKMNDHQLKQTYEKLLSSSQNISDRELKQSIKQLRLLVSKYGLPEILKKEGSNTLRCRVWKIFLGVYKINAQEYCHLIENGATDLHEKIKNDTFRTMPTSKEFTELVDEDMLSRVLNAFVWKTRGNITL
jgi:cell cycle arrest protein BUB2